MMHKNTTKGMVLFFHSPVSPNFTDEVSVSVFPNISNAHKHWVIFIILQENALYSFSSKHMEAMEIVLD